MPAAAPRFNPFPGLRPFTTGEGHLFFGREAQTAELLGRLRRNRFLAAVGPSGSGKSSLVRAGLLPVLYGGMLRGAGSHWRVAVLRPGGDPLRHLLDALIASDIYAADDPDTRFLVQAALRRSSRGLVEAVQRSQLEPDANLLVVVDQFEEIFRFRRPGDDWGDAAAEFVRLLLEASAQSEVPIYIVITMRSDFLGECARYPGLAEAVNQSEYLIPRLNREQWKLAIEGPVRVGGGAIAPRLTQRLLNDVADDPDQLPTLQHALMRAWNRWVATATDGRPLDLEDYEAVGGMTEALSRHADEVYAALPDEAHRAAAERLFRALTELAADDRGLRRPTRLGELVALAEAPESTVRAVIAAFGADGCGFVTPAEALEPGTVVDISHESLMRVWRRLRGWAEAEAQSVRMYRRLADTASLWREGKADFYRDPGLELALQWRAESRPNAAWADRLGGGFAGVCAFLEASEKAREAEREAREAARRRELEQARQLAEAERRRAEVEAESARRMRRLAVAMALLAALAITAGLLAWHAGRVAHARELAALADLQLTTDPARSVELAREARRIHASDLTEDALRRARLASHWRGSLVPPAPRTRTVAGNAAVPFRRVAVSPDGRLVVAQALDVTEERGGQLWFWTAPDRSTNQPCGLGELAALAFATNGQVLLSAGRGDAQALVWDPTQASLRARLPETRDTNIDAVIEAAALSPDGARVVTALRNGRVTLWDWAGAARVNEWSVTGQVVAVRFAPRAGLVATLEADGWLRLWRPGEARPVAERSLLEGEATDLAFSPDERWIAAGHADGARLFQIGPGGLMRPDGWKPVDWQPDAATRVVAVRFSPASDALVLVGGQRGAWLWELAAAAGGKTVPLARENVVFEADFSPDGRWVLTALEGNAAALWSRDGQEVTRFLGHGGQVNGATFTPDGREAITASHDGSVRRWAIPQGELRRQPEGAETLVALAPNGQGSLLQRRGDRRWLLWRPEVARPVEIPDMAPETTGAVAGFGPGATRLAVAEGSRIGLRDGATGIAAAALQGLESRAAALAFSGDGLLLAAANTNGVVRRWRVANGDLAGPDLIPPAPAVRDLTQGNTWLAMNEDGGVLALAQPGSLRALRGGGTNWMSFEPGQAGEPHSLALDRTGRRIAVGRGHGSIWLADTERGGAIQLGRHDVAVTVLAFSPDGTMLASGGGDGSVRLWSVRGAQPLGRFDEFRGGRNDRQRPGQRVIMGLAWSADGRTLTVASRAGEIREFRLPGPDPAP